MRARPGRSPLRWSGLALARTFERGRDRLGNGCQLAGREAHEGHARAVGVTRAARAIPIAIEGRAVAALQAVVLADDPFLHAGLSSLDAVRAGEIGRASCRERV